MFKPITSLATSWWGVALFMAIVVPVMLGRQASSDPYDGLGELKRLSSGTQANFSSSNAYDIAYTLARPISSNPAIVRAVAQFLADEHLAWRNGKKAAIDEEKLLSGLNRQFDLDKAPEYLQFRKHEIRRIRMVLLAQVPELCFNRGQIQGTSEVIGDSLSPFEAYIAAGLLLYQKLYNDDYVRTSSEEMEARKTPEQPLKFGVSFVPSNPRRIEFQQRVATVAGKWSTPAAVLKALRDLRNE